MAVKHGYRADSKRSVSDVIIREIVVAVARKVRIAFVVSFYRLLDSYYKLWLLFVFVFTWGTIVTPYIGGQRRDVTSL